MSFPLISWEISSSWRSYREIRVYAHEWNDDFFLKKLKKFRILRFFSRGLESPSNSKTLIFWSLFGHIFGVIFFNTWKNDFQWDPALRVPPAETRLTVYRRLQVILLHGPLGQKGSCANQSPDQLELNIWKTFCHSFELSVSGTIDHIL